MFFFSFRKVYVLSTTPQFNTQRMIFDINSQKWTVFPVELSLILNCCSGSIVTLRGLQYFFHQLAVYVNPFDRSVPIISRILGNGSIVDLKIVKPPFEEDFNELQYYDRASVQIVPFFQRFYKNVQ